FIHISYNYDYEGEYRLRVTEASPALQMETEPNDSTGNANAPTLALSGQHQVAMVTGAIRVSGDADVYKLGNVTAGITLTLGLSQPSTSGLSGIMAVLNSAGTAVATSASGAGFLTYFIPTGGDGTYYARVTGAAGTSGLLAQYLLSLDVADTTPPTITGVSLP